MISSIIEKTSSCDIGVPSISWCTRKLMMSSRGSSYRAAITSAICRDSSGSSTVAAWT